MSAPPRLHVRLAGTARLATGLAVERRFAFRSRATILRAQSRRVRAMVEHAFRTVPFYRETMRRLGLAPADFHTADDLARLPEIGRADLHREPGRFRSSAYDVRDLLELKSSGRTGEPVSVWHDLASVIANATHGERDRSIWAGSLVPRTGYREAVLGLVDGSDASVQRFLRRGVWLPERGDIERIYLSGLASLDATLAALNAFRPQVLHGYGSMLAALFTHVATRSVPLARPAVVTFSSDEFDPNARAIVERAFALPVFATCEAIEAFKIGFECGHAPGYHLNVDLYPLRVDDAGEVIVSNLVNRATVLLNYRIGDRATLTDEPCPCGRRLPRLAMLEGRRDGVIRRADGSDVMPMSLAGVFALTPGILRYQLEETAPLSVLARVVADPGCDRHATEARLMSGLGGALGEGVRLRVQFVDRIEPAAGGKHLRIIAYAR